ncbi:unnamed protein product [Boreogadus saida]
MKRKGQDIRTFFKKRSVNQRETEEVETQKDSQSGGGDTESQPECGGGDTERQSECGAGDTESQSECGGGDTESQSECGGGDTERQSECGGGVTERQPRTPRGHNQSTCIEVTAQVNQSGRDSPELSRVELGEVST